MLTSANQWDVKIKCLYNNDIQIDTLFEKLFKKQICCNVNINTYYAYLGLRVFLKTKIMKSTLC